MASATNKITSSVLASIVAARNIAKMEGIRDEALICKISREGDGERDFEVEFVCHKVWVTVEERSNRWVPTEATFETTAPMLQGSLIYRKTFYEFDHGRPVRKDSRIPEERRYHLIEVGREAIRRLVPEWYPCLRVDLAFFYFDKPTEVYFPLSGYPGFCYFRVMVTDREGVTRVRLITLHLSPIGEDRVWDLYHCDPGERPLGIELYLDRLCPTSNQRPVLQRAWDSLGYPGLVGAIKSCFSRTENRQGLLRAVALMVRLMPQPETIVLAELLRQDGDLFDEPLIRFVMEEEGWPTEGTREEDTPCLLFYAEHLDDEILLELVAVSTIRQYKLGNLEGVVTDYNPGWGYGMIEEEDFYTIHPELAPQFWDEEIADYPITPWGYFVPLYRAHELKAILARIAEEGGKTVVVEEIDPSSIRFA